MGKESGAPTTPQWKLRRLAARTIKVHGRHKAVSGAIAAYEGSLIPSCVAYVAAYDAAASYQPKWRKEMDEGKGAMAALITAISAWKPHLARELPGLDIATIGDKPTVPEDLVEDGFRLSEALGQIKGADGATPGWATHASTELDTLSQSAERETDEAAAADAQLAELLAAVRASGVAFEGHLSLFRQTLRSVLGRSHPDFQKLRAEKATATDEDDDPGAPQPSPPVTPAPAPPAG